MNARSLVAALATALALAASLEVASGGGDAGLPPAPPGPAELSVDGPIPGSIEGGVAALAFSPDGKLLAAGGNDGTLAVVELAPRTASGAGAKAALPGWRTVSKGTTAIAGLAFVAVNERSFIVFGDDRGLVSEVTIPASATTEAELLALPGTVLFDAGVGPITALCALPAHAKEPARVVVGGSHGALAVVRLGPPLELERALGASHEGPVAALAVLPHDRVASAGFDGRVRVTDVATGREVKAAKVSPLELAALAASPDGKTLAVGGWRRGVDVLDAATLRPAGPPLEPHPGATTALAFARAPEPRAPLRLVSASIGDECVGVTELAAPGARAAAPASKKTKQAGVPSAVAAAADGTRLACGAFDGTVVLYRLEVAAAGGPKKKAAAHAGGGGADARE